MGLFSNNYESAGPGIPKNAPKKKGFFRYWEIFGRKFWKLIELNFLYFLFYIPLIASTAVFLIDALSTTAAYIIIAILCVIFAIIIGPATAAFMKILKCFYMEKPVFMVHEFFKTFKSEFKHGAVIGFLDCIVACCIAAACYVYPQLIEQTESNVYYIFFAISLSVGLVVLMMNFYTFLLMISTTLSLKNILKNSLALAIIALKKNVITLLILAAVAVIYGLIFYFVDLQYSLLLILFLPVMPGAWLGLAVVVNSYPVIQKYIINPYYEERGEINPELQQVEPDEEDTVFEDMGGKEKPIEPKKKAKEGKSGGSKASKGHKGKIIS